MNDLPELLADCDAHGIRLMPAGDGGLTIDAPQDALTPGLMERLKSHKGELMVILQPEAAAITLQGPRFSPSPSCTAILPCLTATSATGSCQATRL